MLSRKFGCVAAALVSLFAVTFARGATVEVVSPKDEQKTDVVLPMLFWRTVPGAASYRVTVDGGEPLVVKTSGGAVAHVPVPGALSAGGHVWSVVAVTPGSEVKSRVQHLTIEPTHVWPACAIGPFLRYAGNPVLTPTGDSWQARNAYNPGVIFDHDQFRMMYRGQAKSMKSQEGYAASDDGVNFQRDAQPVIAATENFENVYGCEDARFYKLGDAYYAFYTGNVPGTNHVAECEATSKDGHAWTKLGVILPNTKNGAVVCDSHDTPVKINGKYTMYTGNNRVGLCTSEDLLHWGPVSRIDLGLPANWSKPYEPCFAVTNRPDHPGDIVLFIAGTLNGKGKWYYAISEVLLKQQSPEKVADRLDDCIFKPSEPYESGEFKQCLWMNGIVEHDGQWWLYYGAGDRNVGLANAPVR